MASNRELILKLSADVADLRAGFASAIGSFQQLGSAAEATDTKLQKTASSLTDLGTKLSVGLTAPLVGFATIALKTATDFDSLQRGLEAVTGSAAEAGKQFERFKELAKLPGLGFKEVADAALQLQAAGFSAAGAERSIRAFGNALATVGKGREDLMGVVVQLQQMSNKANVVAQDLKPIIERVPQVAMVMRNLFGSVDSEAISAKLKATGKSTHDFIAQVVAELEKLPTTTGGIRNSFENLKDSMTFTLGEIGKALIPFAERGIAIIEPFIQWIGKLGEEFRQLSPATQGFVVAAAGMAAALGPALFAIGQMANGFTAISTVIQTGGLLVALKGVAIAAAAVGVAWGAWKLGEWLTTFEPVQKALGYLQTSLVMIRSSLAQLPGVKISNDAAEAAFASLSAKASQTMAAITGDLSKSPMFKFDLSGLASSAEAAAKKAAAAIDQAFSKLGLSQAKNDVWELTQAYDLLNKQGLLTFEQHVKGLNKIGDATENVEKATRQFIGEMAGYKKLWDDFNKTDVKLDSAQRLKTIQTIYPKEFFEEQKRALADLEKLHDAMDKIPGVASRVGFALAKMSLKPIADLGEAYKHFGIVGEQEAERLVGVLDKQYADILNNTKLSLTERLDLDKRYNDERVRLAALAGDTIAAGEVAMHKLGVASSQEMALAAKRAHDLFQQVAESARSTRGDIDQAALAAMETEAKAMIARGEAITETFKRQMEKLKTATEEGHKDMLTQWDAFANGVGDAVAGIGDKFFEILKTGKGSLSGIWKDTLNEMRAAFMEAFIAPVQKAFKEFISATVAGLLSGEGLGGAITNVKEMADSIKTALGVGKTVADVAKTGKTVADVAGSAADFGAVAKSASGAGGAAAQVVGSTLMGTIGAIGSAASAISGIVGNFQMSAIGNDTGKMEVTLRELKAFIGENGSESIFGFTKGTMMRLDEIKGRWDIYLSAFAGLMGTTEEIRDKIGDSAEITGRLDTLLQSFASLMTTCEQIRDKTAGTSVSLTGDIGNIGPAVAESVGKAVSASVATSFDSITTILRDTFDFTQNRITPLLEGIRNYLQGFTANGLGNTGKETKPTTIVGLPAVYAADILPRIQTLFQDVRNLSGSIAAGNRIPGANEFQNVAAQFKAISDTIANGVGADLKDNKDLQTLMAKLGDEIRNLSSAAGKVPASGRDAAKTAADEIASAYADLSRQIENSASQITEAGDSLSGASSTASLSLTRLSDATGAAATSISDSAAKIGEAAKNALGFTAEQQKIIDAEMKKFREAAARGEIIPGGRPQFGTDAQGGLIRTFSDIAGSVPSPTGLPITPLTPGMTMGNAGESAQLAARSGMAAVDDFVRQQAADLQKTAQDAAAIVRQGMRAVGDTYRALGETIASAVDLSGITAGGGGLNPAIGPQAIPAIDTSAIPMAQGMAAAPAPVSNSTDFAAWFKSVGGGLTTSGPVTINVNSNDPNYFSRRLPDELRRSGVFRG